MNAPAKLSSWLLIPGFILCGVFLIVDMAKFKEVYAELEIAMPRLSATICMIGPWAFFALAAASVFDEFRLHSRALFRVIAAGMLVLFVSIVVALFLPLVLYLSRAADAAPIHAVERTASQPTGSLGEVGVRGGWLAVAHFYRSTDCRSML